MSAPPDVPPIVARAFDVSRRAGYVSFCRNETGRLLAALAATRAGHDGRVRHRLRCRYGVAALGRAARGDDPVRRAGRAARGRRPGDLRSTTRRSRCSPRTGRRCATRAPTRCSSWTPPRPRTPRVDSVADLVEPRRHRRDGRLHAVRDVAADDAGRVDALREALADRRAVHLRRGDGGAGRLGAHRHPELGPLGVRGSLGSGRGSRRPAATPAPTPRSQPLGSQAPRLRAARPTAVGQTRRSPAAAATGRAGRSRRRTAPCPGRRRRRAASPRTTTLDLQAGPDQPGSRRRYAGAARSSVRPADPARAGSRCRARSRPR